MIPPLLLLLLPLLPTQASSFCVKCADTCNGTAYLDVTIPSSPTPLETVAVCWSFMPYVCTTMWIIFTIGGRTTTAVYGYILSGMIAATNEVFIKNALDVSSVISPW